jgi:hypothetical protein
MNRKEFIEAIKKIGWTVKGSWHGLNDRLVSPTGAVTDIRVNEDSLEPYSNELYGGESFYIQAKWYFKDAKINEKDGYVSINNLLLMNHKL